MLDKQGEKSPLGLVGLHFRGAVHGWVGVKMVLRCLSCIYVLLGSDRNGQNQEKQPVAGDL